MSFDIFKKNTVNKPPTGTPKNPKEEKNKHPIDTGESVSRVAFDLKINSIEARLDNSKLLLIGLIIVMVSSFIVLLYGYFSFASTSYNDYKNSVNQLQNDKYQFQQQEVNFLINLSTNSATIK